MAYLLDTHALIWWWDNDVRLGHRVTELLERRTDTIHVSAVSGLEIATKVRLGKLPSMVLPISEYPSNIEQGGFFNLPISPAHARLGGLLPGTHRDPFDRVLAAQAIMEGLVMVTRDACFTDFGCEVFW